MTTIQPSRTQPSQSADSTLLKKLRKSSKKVTLSRKTLEEATELSSHHPNQRRSWKSKPSELSTIRVTSPFAVVEEVFQLLKTVKEVLRELMPSLTRIFVLKFWLAN